VRGLSFELVKTVRDIVTMDGFYTDLLLANNPQYYDLQASWEFFLRWTVTTRIFNPSWWGGGCV